MKLPKTIQLDISDTHIFEGAAKSGEWAVTGSFSFSDVHFEDLNRKQKIAFKSAWMGLESGGYSTLVQVVSVSSEEFENIIAKLAEIFVTGYGAPDVGAAMPVARDEVLYVASLCEFDEGTLLSMLREPGADGLREVVHAVNRPNNVDQVEKVWELTEE